MVSALRATAARHRPPKQSTPGVALHFQSIVSRTRSRPSLSGAGFCRHEAGASERASASSSSAAAAAGRATHDRFAEQPALHSLRLDTITPSPAGRL